MISQFLKTAAIISTFAIIFQISSQQCPVISGQPPSAMVSNTDVINGITYTISGSPISNGPNLPKFDYFYLGNKDYGTHHVYLITTETVKIKGKADIVGCWIQFYSSAPVIIQYYELTLCTNWGGAPWELVLLGSMDGIQFDYMDTQTPGVNVYTNHIPYRYTVSKQLRSYNYYRLVVTKIGGDTAAVKNIGYAVYYLAALEFQVFGCSCDIACVACIGSPTNCADWACVLGDNRDTTILPHCPCLTGFYEVLNDYNCYPCSYVCNTCTAGASDIQCDTCDPADFRQLTGASPAKCVCMPGYNDTLSTSANNVKTCYLCSYTCELCTDSSGTTSCLTCPIYSSSKRVFNVNTNSITGSCDCNIGFGDNLVPTCITCQYFCRTCQTIDNNCITCFDSLSTKRWANSLCSCFPRYYDVGQLICQKCDYNCYDCLTTASNCVSCMVGANRVMDPSQKCPCLTGYIDLGGNVCQKCEYTCLTCQLALDNCASCDPLTNRVLVNNQCLPATGYFDTGVSTSQKCNYQCLACVNALSCNACPDNTITKRIDFSQINGTCPCSTLYFDDQTQNQVCQACYVSCSSCNGPFKNNCIVCLDSQLIAINGVCVCPDGFYYNQNTQLCEACDISCRTCSDSTNSSCLSCNKNSYFQSQTCVKQCDESLYFQFETNNTCLNCQNSLLYYQGNCINKCSSDTYLNKDSSGKLSCQRCGSSCQTCQGAQHYQCLSCYNTQLLCGGICFQDCTSEQVLNQTCINENNFQYVQTSCCNLGNSFSMQTNKCFQCYYTCSTCFNMEYDGCLTCPADRELVVGMCVCKLQQDEDKV